MKTSQITSENWSVHQILNELTDKNVISKFHPNQTMGKCKNNGETFGGEEEDLEEKKQPSSQNEYI